MVSAFPWSYVLAGGSVTLVGLVLFGWAMLADGAKGRRRCPRCWYDMSGLDSLRCPECGHAARSERQLLRTRRHWRRASLALVIGLTGLASIVWPIARSQNPWSYAPDVVLIRTLPNVSTGREGFAGEFQRRNYYTRNLSGWLVWGPERVEVGSVDPATRALLAESALNALERSPAHPWRDDLLQLLGELDANPVRAGPLLFRAMTSSAQDTRIAALRAVRDLAPDPDRAVPMLIARVSALHATVGDEPSRDDDAADDHWDREDDVYELSQTIAALGGYGARARDAVPALLPLFDVQGTTKGPWVQGDLMWTLAQIGPDAAEALPYLTVDNPDLDSSAWECLGCLIAELMIKGRFTDRESAVVWLADHPSWRTRRQVVHFLASSRELAERNVTVLVQLLDDPSSYVADQAADSLLDHGLMIDAAREALLRVDPPDSRNSVWTRVQLLERHGLDATPLAPQVRQQLDRLLEMDAYETTVENFSRLLERLERQAADEISDLP